MKLQSLKTIHWVAIVIAVLATTYAVFYSTSADAGYYLPISTITVSSFLPQSERETFMLGFDGFFNQNVTADLTGWTLKNSRGTEYSLSDVVLTSSDDLKFCNEGPKNDCDYVIPESDIFLDEADSLVITNNNGNEVLRIDYDETYTGSPLSHTKANNYSVYVNTPSDKISICEMQQNGGYKASNANVQKITRDLSTPSEDIIPPFVYERNKERAYYPGSKWTDENEAILNNDCK